MVECALPVDILIPFYRQASLVKNLFESLHRVAGELAEVGCEVVAINDSPDDPELKDRLREAVDSLAKVAPCRLIENTQNVGFGKSINRAAQESVSKRRDVILLNSDTIVFPGAIREIVRVGALDPMVGFVSPRSNNATICSFPLQEEFQHLAPEQSYEIFRALSGYLPEYHYVPVGVGFCLYIKLQILDEFGYLDEIYGRGYNEENDLILRANRCGYQAALANHAFVYHVGEASFKASASPKEELEKQNSKILLERYPEYPRSVAKYFNGVHYRAEKMLSALLPDSSGKLDLVFDFSSMGTYHNGTFAAAKCILEAALETWQDRFHVYAMVSEEAQRFHNLDRLKGLLVVRPDTQRTFAIAFRFGQPFDFERLDRMSRVGVLNVYMMLDTIAMDCLYLHQLNLETLWGTVFNYADAVLYNSNFVEEQFHRRFRRRPGLKEMAALHSLAVEDYRQTSKDGEAGAGSYLLVVGNAFAHKYVKATVDALSKAFPREKIVALGPKDEQWHNVTAYPSGNLSDDQMRNLLRGAKAVIFPSHYEGFGIPVVESLAYGKPVLARSIPVIRELREHLPSRENLILYASTRELLERLSQGCPTWVSPAASSPQPLSWKSGTAEIGEFLWRLLETWDFREHLLPRLGYMRILQDHREELEGPAPSAMPGQKGEDGKNLRKTDSYAVSELKAQLLDREARIVELENSLSWKITAPLRTMGSIYLRLMGK